MVSLIYQMLSWMPMPLFLVCCGVVSIFVIVTILRVVKLILDVIPFA